GRCFPPRHALHWPGMTDGPDPTPGSMPTPPASATSLSLLERLRADDPDAWNRLVRLYGPLVLYWGRRAGLNEADAADLLQDVFRSVAGARGRVPPQRPADDFPPRPP